MAKGYNGHKNWNHWNVSLWMFNSESLYRVVIHELEKGYTLDETAKNILHDILRCCSSPLGIQITEGVYLSGRFGQFASTPDGARYTKTSVRSALTGLR
jgi:hypothetical protein